jgi:putative hydrolase of the HAD superfamily
MPRFLLFDAYGTLVELDDFSARLQRGFAARGASFPLEAIRRAAQREMRHYIQHAQRARDETSRDEVRRECAGVLAAALREQEYSLEWPDAAVQEVLIEAIAFRAYPETAEVLAALHARGVAMGVLSNWDYGLGEELEKLDLARFFRFVLTSAQAGAQKPQRAFFERGLQHARREYSNLAAGECYYIGDHYEKDVLGARAAGLTPLWLVRDRRDLASGDTREADDKVTRLASLRDLRSIEYRTKNVE